VVWLVVTAVFVLQHLQHGQLYRLILGRLAYPAEIAAFNKATGLSDPLPVQYGHFLLWLLRGQLTFAGSRPNTPWEVINEYASGVSLQQLVVGPLTNTLLLMGLAMLVSVPAGLALGTWLAASSRATSPRRSSLTTKLVGALRATVNIFSLAGYGIPVMVLGLFLTQVLAVDAGLLPFNMIQWVQGDVLSDPAGLVLPVLTLAIPNVALFSHYSAASMSEGLVSDYAIKAQAVGASTWRILTRHVARNAAVSVATIAATRIPMIFSIQVVLEAYFQYPGIGNLAFEAASAKETPTVLGAVLVVGVLVVAFSFAADMVCMALDPRLF